MTTWLKLKTAMNQAILDSPHDEYSLLCTSAFQEMQASISKNNNWNIEINNNAEVSSQSPAQYQMN